MKMPVLFVGHGNPMNAIEENEFVTGFREIAQQLPTPNSILCISAHWETRGTQITSMKQPRTIHDFYGFPAELYDVQYPAPGNPELAIDIRQQLTNDQILADTSWGLDHGCWSVIRHFYPLANVPIIEMSLDNTKSPIQHYKLAQDLAYLREKGVLIVASGNLVHNLRMVNWQHLNTPGFAYDWATEANEKMKQFILSDNIEALSNYTQQGQAFNLAVPTPEHFIPLLYTLALRQENDNIQFFNDKAVAGSLTMTSVKIG